MPIRRVSTPNMFRSSEYYDHTHSYLQGYKIDWSRMSAAQSRQSAAGADYTYLESRLNQESMVETAMLMRPDHNLDMVLELDEGAGVSGQKKIYQRPKLKTGWDYLINGLLGTWFVAREDRLFRDRHGTQSSAFTEKCQEHHCILIIPGKRCYDFSRDDDLAVFKKKMEEAAAYLRHIKYMTEMMYKKRERGEWIGGGISAPYAIDRVAIARMKEQIKQQRQFGLRASDIEITLEMSQAYRPVIYQPWLERSLDLFEKMKLFNYETARLMRYIEEKQFVFPFPSAEDQMRYIFKNSMKRVAGGYTFSRAESAEMWLTNLQHLGWMIAGKDEESGEYIYLEDCFKGAIPRDDFEETYIQIKGEDLDGNLVERARNKARFTRAAPTGRTDALLLRCFQVPQGYSIHPHHDKGGNNYYRCISLAYAEGTPSEGTFRRKALWNMQQTPFERAIVERLASLAKHDKELATRIRAYFAQQKEAQTSDKNLIMQDIEGLERKYKHLQWLKTDESLGQTVQQIQEIVREQRDISHKIDEAKKKLNEIREKQPSEVIPRFYDVLENITGEFWGMGLDHKRKMLRSLIDTIQVEVISPHVYALCVNWIAPVSTRGDTALLYRSSTKREVWTPEEDELLREIYPSSERLEIRRRFPNRSWQVIEHRTHNKGLKRTVHTRFKDDPFHDEIAYNDLVKTCEYYGIDPESEEGQSILWMLNTCADQIEKKEIIFQWLIPAEKKSIKAVIEGEGEQDQDLLTTVIEHSRESVPGARRANRCAICAAS